MAALALIVSASACVGDSFPPRPDDDDARSEKDAGAKSPVDEPAMCAPSKETNGCFQCTDENCCHEYEACNGDPRCQNYYKVCIPECTKRGSTFSECVVECASDNGAGHAKYATYYGCAQLHCLAPCAENEMDLCVQCQFASCRDEVHACDVDPECDLLRACMTICLDQPDYDACTAACNEGSTGRAQRQYNELIGCSLQFCQKPCMPQ